MASRTTVILERVEAGAGLLLFAVSGLSMVGGCVWAIFLAPPSVQLDRPLFAVIATGYSAAVLATSYFLLNRFARAHSPVLVDIAERQADFNPYFTVAIATWWMWHFCTMTVAADSFWAMYRVRFTGLSHGPTAWFIRLAVVYSASAAANLFLLLTLGLAYRGNPLMRRIYRMRFVLDLAFTLALLSVPPGSLRIFEVPFHAFFYLVFGKR